MNRLDANTKPLISVIVPVYNVQDYIKQCVESICEQTYRSLEIILVNDGSKDESRAKCEELARIDNRIKIIDKENGGLSSARNAGIEVAKGKFVSFIDSDDYIENTMIERLYTLLTESNADIACCNFDSVNEQSEFISRHKIRFKGFEKYNKEKALELMLAEDYFKCFAWNKLFHKAFFETIRFPTGRLYEDIGTLYEIIKKSNTVTFASDTLYHYRVRENSITRTEFNDKEYDLLIPIRKIQSENNNNKAILAGCCIYYLYFLDDMVLCNKWDAEIYGEFRELYMHIRDYLKTDEIYSKARKMQMSLCARWIGGYKFIYQILRKIKPH